MPRTLDEYEQDVDDVLIYTINWAPTMTADGSDTISTSSWSVDISGPTLDNATATTTQTTIRFSGGTVGQIYRVTNQIVTAGGRTYNRSIDIEVVNF